MNSIVVGNGPCPPYLGGAIDQFDEVIRFNNFKTEGHEQSVGSKTTTWVTSFYKDIQPRDCSEFQLIFCPFPIYSERWKRRYQVNEVAIPDKFFRYHKCIPEDIFEELIQLNENPSTGLAFLWWTYTVYGKLPPCVGFSHFEGTMHYFDNAERCSHNGDSEKKIIEDMYAGKL